MVAIPRSVRFADQWEADSAAFRARLEWPIASNLLDIRQDNIWIDEWEAKPPPMNEAIAVAFRRLCLAPRLLRTYGHRYLPAQPC
jgi:hypothetical protein